MYGIERVERPRYAKGGKSTELSLHVQKVLGVVAAMGDGTYQIHQDEHGEPFADVEKAKRFAESMRDSANRMNRKSRDATLKVTRHRTEVYVTKETYKEVI